MKQIHRRLVVLLLVLAALFSLGGCGKVPACTPLTVTLLKVGKADAIVAISGSHAMLIDAGEEEDGLEVTEFLRKCSITELDAMIITHFDQDHVGGADTVLEQFPVKAVYVPDYQGTHPEYRDFLAAAEGASVELRQWLADSQPEACDFLKVPHHGIYNKALEELFGTLKPQYAVICSSQKNPAEYKTLELLKACCPHIFETKDGNVTVISDGSTLEVQQKIKS